MSQVQVEQKRYQMPPQRGDHHRAFSHRRRHRAISSLLRKGLRRSHSEQGDGNAPGYIQIANTWLIVNVGGGPTPDKPR